LRGFGLKVGATTPKTFETRVRELAAGSTTLTVIVQALLAARAVLEREFQGFEKRVRALARADQRARLLMTTPGVGAIVALTYASAIDDPKRFTSSKQVGAHFGLTPRKYQSGETDVTGRISKIGEGHVRAVLYEAANVILTRPVKGGALKSWAMRVAGRAGMRKAKGSARPQARRDPAPYAGERNVVRCREGRGGPSRLSEEGDHEFGRSTDTRRPEQVPSPGRWIRPGRRILSGAARRPRAPRSATCSSSDPIRWRPRRRPRTEARHRRQDRSSKRGLTTDGPLQKQNPTVPLSGQAPSRDPPSPRG
jgi:hypothetical protein